MICTSSVICILSQLDILVLISSLQYRIRNLRIHKQQMDIQTQTNLILKVKMCKRIEYSKSLGHHTKRSFDEIVKRYLRKHIYLFEWKESTLGKFLAMAQQ